MDRMKLIEIGLREWAEQVEQRRQEIVADPSLIDQEMIVCMDVGELSRSEVLDVEMTLDSLDDDNIDFVIEEHYGDYVDYTGAVTRMHLSKKLVRDNFVDVYEYRDGVLRIAVSYCYSYHRFEGGFDYFDIARETYEEILDNLTEVPADEYYGYGDEPDDESDEECWDENMPYWDRDNFYDADLNDDWGRNS